MSENDANAANQTTASDVINSCRDPSHSRGFASSASKTDSPHSCTSRCLTVTHRRIDLRDAREQAVEPDVVQVNAAFRISTVPRDTEDLLAIAEEWAKAGEQYQATLVARGLPPTFVADLREAVAALKAEVDARRQHNANRRGSTEGIATAIEDGRKLILSLSALVTKRLRGNPVALAEWRQIKRVTLKGVRGSDAAPETGSVAPGASSAAS